MCDPLVASALGNELAPAFRGIAYLVFENFDFSSFGNRLPMITVEVASGPAMVLGEEVISDGLGLSAHEPTSSHQLKGYALSGDDMAGALAPLYEALAPNFAYSAEGWAIGSVPTLHVIEDELWTLLPGSSDLASDAGQVSESPSKVSIRYFDPAIDFAASEKCARLPGQERLQRIELPAAVAAGQAKALAFEQLERLNTGLATAWLRLPLRYAHIKLGDGLVSASDMLTAFKVCALMLGPGEIKFQVRKEKKGLSPLPGDAGGIGGRMVLGRKPLSVSLLELPTSSGDDTSDVAVLVSGGHEPFQALTVHVSADGVSQDVLSASRPSPQGILQQSLPSGAHDLLDERYAIEVVFEHDPKLLSVDEATLYAGANLIRVGQEFIQFATAKPLGAAAYRLSGLIRGLYDSGGDTQHQVGSAVHIINASSYCIFTVPRERFGGTYTVCVYGPDGQTASETLTVLGLAHRPWAPDHIQVVEDSVGLEVTWVRRSVDERAWLDGADAMIGSGVEAYVLSLADQNGRTIHLETGIASAHISYSELALLGARPWLLEVRQIDNGLIGNVRTHIIP
ncbi:hypothetical protein GCM10022211_16800 [Sphingomonas humi]|uniref:Tip attachment protein J domain-containing protein n=2 Tax=Sphingomonas humi TaxID=335630 RepID=A0ABP7S148_9SPHN